MGRMTHEPKSQCCGGICVSIGILPFAQKNRYDACSKCEKPFIPASNYERDRSHTHCWNQQSPACGQSLDKHTQCCLCSAVTENSDIHHTCTTHDSMVHETPDWMDKEREAFKTFSTVVSIEVVRDPSKDIEKIICDYWILRIEEARKEGYEKGFDAGGQTKGGTGRIMYQRGLEQGRQEEKARINETIERIENLIDNVELDESQTFLQHLKNEIKRIITS